MAEQVKEQAHSGKPHLEKALGPIMLWSLGVGYVISGMYFGWNLGLPAGGTYGMMIATLIISVMYITFIYSYTELACAIPKAGGAFDYGLKAFGRTGGSLAGTAQLIEFVFAPPAIAVAIGTYLQSSYFPSLPVPVLAVAAYAVFTGINIMGVKQAAIFELFVTVLAVLELLLFMGITAPSFSVEKFSTNAMPGGIEGVFACLPFAIWFYLAIEGVANAAEEAKNPQRDVAFGFGAAIITLVILAFGVFFTSIGVDGWATIVYPNPADTATTSDAPLLLAMQHVAGDGFWYHLLASVGIFGLVASLHGIIMAGSRASMEMGRVHFAPRFLGEVNGKTHTPINALIANFLVGAVAIFSGKTGDIITLSCFGAIFLYIISMASLFQLRKKEPNLPRPFKAILYPYFPAIAMSIAAVSLVAMFYYNVKIGLIFVALMALAFVFSRGRSVA